MAAQPGNGLILNYGAQGNRQTGDTLVLRYGAAVTPAVRLVAGLNAPWRRQAVHVDPQTRAPYRTPIELDPERRAPWIRRTPLHDDTAGLWSPSTPRDNERRALWTPYPIRRHMAGQLLPWLASKPRDHEQRAPWAPYPIRRHLQGLLAPWAKAVPQDRERRAPWGLSRAADGRELHAPAAAGRTRDLEQWVPWVRFSRLLNPGWGVVTPPGPTPDEHGTWVVPILQAYIMINETFLTRVSDGAAIPCLGMRLSLDVDSWTWSFSGSVPFIAYSLLADGPTEVEAAINGTPIRLVIESMQRTRVFGKDALAINGRGRNAELGDPYSPVLNFAATSTRTAAQLAGDVLTENNVPLPWTIDWQLDDWLVPAGAWALQATRIDAIRAIAAAAGGYVQPHDTDQVLRILHRYPVAPWEWSTMTPDFQLPAQAIQQEGVEWVKRPDYNRVFVVGQSVGVRGDITRAGTAGDIEAGMIVDALATAAEAVTQRGRAVLSDTGAQAHYTLRLPVLEESGLIVPGKSVRYVEGTAQRIGLVRSIGVDVAPGQVWQTIKVETHA